MKTYRETLTLRTRDCDFKGEWRLSAILESLQEAAGGHCDRLGCGRSALRKKGIAWVLLRNELLMARYPVIDETVSIETFHTPTRHRLFPRYFIIRDAEERTVGTASSLWVLMDLLSRQSVIPDEIASLLPDNSDLRPPMPLPGRIMPIANGRDTEILYHPAYTDLDANGHMNNARYADVLCNCLGVEMMQRHQVESIAIHYFAEVLPEQRVVHSDGSSEALGLGGYLDIGINDTMKDLLVNLLGAVIFSIIGYFYVKQRGQGRFAARFIPRVLMRNDFQI